jgi:hypothetical protein
MAYATPRSLALTLALFLAPPGAIAGVFEVALWRLGETVPLASAAAEPDQESIWGRALLSQQFDVLKWAAWVERRPDVVALGSSRVMQIRGALFGTSFYNAGGLLQDLGDLDHVVDALESGELPRPKLLLLGVDPWWFSSATSLRGGASDRRDDTWSFAAHVGAWRGLLRAILSGDDWGANRDPATGASCFGLRARRLGDGERGSDGSHQYGSFLREFVADPRYRDREVPPMVERVAAGTHQFAPGALAPERVERFTAVLGRLAATSGMAVAILVPPVSSEVAGAIAARPDFANTWQAAEAAILASAATAGVPVSGPHVPGDLSLDDRAMFDGVHAGEVLAAAQLAVLAPRLGRPDLLDGAALRARIVGAGSPLTLGSLEAWR